MELTGDPLLIALQITVTGVTVVFTALAVVALALSALRGVERIVLRRSAERAAARQAALPLPRVELPSDELSPALVAVLAAAAAELLDQPVRVTRVRYYDHQPGGVWSRQGRLTIMASRQRRG